LKKYALSNLSWVQHSVHLECCGHVFLLLCYDIYVCLLENWNLDCAKFYEFWSKVRFWKAPKLRYTTPLPPLWGYLLYYHSPLALKLIKLACTSDLQQHEHWTKIGNAIVFTPLIEIEINPPFLKSIFKCVFVSKIWCIHLSMFQALESFQ
jgi:hypothetical protein